MRRSVIGTRVGLLLAVSTLTASHPVAGQSPSASADTGLDAALAAVELMNEVPVGIRETCGPSTVELEGVVASTNCLHGAGVAIYARFDSLPNLQAGYDFIAAATGVAPESGTDCGEGPFEGEFTAADGSAAGRLLCVLAPEGLTALWIHPDRSILGVVQLLEGTDYQVLEDAWQAARVDTASPTASAAPSSPPVVSSAPPASTPPASAPPASAPPPASSAPAASLEPWRLAAAVGRQRHSQLRVRSRGLERAQATGEPDTPDYGDYATAWAPATADGGPAWLEVSYEQAVIPDGGGHLGDLGQWLRHPRGGLGPGRRSLGDALGRPGPVTRVRRRLQPRPRGRRLRHRPSAHRRRHRRARAGTRSMPWPSSESLPDET